MNRRIDSHQHFWKYNPERDAWITDDMNIIRKDFLPSDLKPLLEENRVEGCVAVQADTSNEETLFLLELAAQNPFIKGVVGWVDLLAEDLEETLEDYVKEAKLKGFRHILQAEPDGFMKNPKFVKAVNLLGSKGYCYDVLVTHKQLEETVAFASMIEETPLVIDHIAKPDIKNGEVEHWEKYMSQLAKQPYIYVKLSGMVTEADWKNWTSDDLKKYISTTLDLFGTERVMFGSDWPVCLVAASYRQVVDALEKVVNQLTVSEKASIFGSNASRFYNL